MNQAQIRRTGLAAQPLPALGHGLWLDRFEAGEHIAWLAGQLAPTHLELLADLRLPGSVERVCQGLDVCRQCRSQAWLLLIVDDHPSAAQAQLQAVAQALRGAPLQPSGVLVTPGAYLDSYQPDAQWPTGLSPQQALHLARQTFAGWAIGAGVPTYFTELNRCRPFPGSFDYLTHATSPTVHAADDLSVIESLQALPDIFRSAQHLAQGRAYRVTTSAIGAWCNPYGGRLTANPERERLTLSNRDPRQHGLLAAAWTLGYYAAAQRAGVQACALWALNEPFAVAEAGRCWPVFHLLRTLAGGRNGAALAVESTSADVCAVGWRPGPDGLARLCVANLSAQPVALTFDGFIPQASAVLDAGFYAQALEDPLWLQHRSAAVTALQPFAVAVIDCAYEVEPAL